MRNGGRFRRWLGVVAAVALLLPVASHADPLPVFVGRIVPVGDLDGDGVADLAVANGNLGPDALTAYSGATGTMLWSAAGLFPQDVRPVRLGPGGVAGVLYTSYGTGTGVGVVDRQGRLVWQRQWPDSSPATVTAFLVGDFVRGLGDDVLVAWHVGDAYDTGGRRFAEALDGATGLTTAVFGTQALTWWDAAPEAAGDLDGDGTADVVWAEPHDDTSTVLRAFSGDGRLLWQNGANTFSANSGITPVGDVTGDGRPDFTVLSGENTPHADATTLVSGADGRVVWTRPGLATYALGDVDGDRRPDVVTSGMDGSLGRVLNAYDGTGRRLYRRAVPFTALEPAGDVDGDGVPDLRGHTDEDVDDRTGSRYGGPHEGFVSARTGRVLRTNAHAREWPLRASIDCRGTDTIAVTPGTTTDLVRALDGRTGRTLWSLTVPIEREYPGIGVTALPGRCADVLVSSSAGYTVRVAPDGRVRWRLGSS